MRHMDANFIGLFSHSHSHSHSTGAHAMPVLGPEFGIKCQKVTRRVASTRKLCNILLNVSISVTLSSDLAQTVAVFSGKFRLLFWGLACHADRPVTATATTTATLKGISRATTMTDGDGKWPPALTASFQPKKKKTQEQQRKKKKSSTRVTARLATSLSHRVVELPQSQAIAESCRTKTKKKN